MTVAPEPGGRWGQLAILAAAVLLALAPWFSAPSVGRRQPRLILAAGRKRRAKRRQGRPKLPPPSYLLALGLKRRVRRRIHRAPQGEVTFGSGPAAHDDEPVAVIEVATT